MKRNAGAWWRLTRTSELGHDATPLRESSPILLRAFLGYTACPILSTTAASQPLDSAMPAHSHTFSVVRPFLIHPYHCCDPSALLLLEWNQP